MQQGARQLEGLRIAALRQLREHGTARIGQAHELGRFVECLARRIVDGFTEDFVFTHAVHTHELGMPPRDQQGHKRELGRVGTQER
ncbi:hypothetical protein SDC9_185862 [bioreactor metagenome]|uniref:Uncharacterized protein n=1 Tax=bioreactor metagenome TaxID=1076179 RepID=A0A645HH23_9ZZZZ